MKYLCIFLLFLFLSPISAQNQYAKWIFGQNAGLDFMTSPPAVTSSPTLMAGSAGRSCCFSDAQGNLLFYTNGNDINNKNMQVMANGNNYSTSGAAGFQGRLAVKQPGNNNNYFIFSHNYLPANPFAVQRFAYTIVDMSLAAGLGSVTVKSMLINSPAQDMSITGTRHCNGVDVWIVTRDSGSTGFRSYLLTATGLNTVAVISNCGFVSLGLSSQSYMEISPNGKKMARSGQPASLEIYDFDNSTGQVSNAFSLAGSFTANSVAGDVTFSPDNSKLYAGPAGGSSLAKYYQWDLCGGTNQSILNSVFAQTGPAGLGGWDLALAPDGRIYIGRVVPVLSIICNPNSPGLASNYSLNAISMSPGSATHILPNFILSDMAPKPPPPPFTFTAGVPSSCNTVSFTAPNLGNNCPTMSYSVTNIVWNFNDPGSGGSNIAASTNPVHQYSGPGSYTPSLIIYYQCGSDTLKQVITIGGPSVGISSQSITCASLGSATANLSGGIGPFSYTWFPVMQNNAVATSLAPGNYTFSVVDGTTGCIYNFYQNFASLVPLTGNLLNSPSISCNSANTGTATFINIAGGSGSEIYTWSNGVSTFTSNSALITTLTAGNWSVTVTDALTACQINSVFVITQPQASTLSLVASSPTTCAGTGITFTATNSGGTPGNNPAYTYTWVAGPNTDTHTSVQNTAGNYVYTVNSFDAYNCLSTATIAANFVPNPTLSVVDVSICPLETGTLFVSGASTYTWMLGSPQVGFGSTFTDSPVGSAQYTVVGSALSCTSLATASILVKPTPIPFIYHNSPLCENRNLMFSVNVGTAAVWSGPQSFNSASQSNTINNVSFNQGGVYTVTITSINSCTASTSLSFTVKPLPQFSIGPASSSICLNTTTANLQVNGTATSYSWFPNQSITTNTGSAVGAYPTSNKTYTVIGSLNGCTNTSQATVNVVPPPSLNGSFNSSTLCSQAFNGSPNTITLTAGGATTYSLVTIPDMFNANPAGPVSPLTTIPPYTGAGSATLSGSNGVCTVTLGLTFTVIPNPSITVNSYTPVICAGETFTYTNQGASTYTWSSATPGSTLFTTGSIAVAHPSINSVFSVYGGSLGCNSALQTTSITVNPVPTVVINPDPAKICVGSTVELSAQSNANSFLWMPITYLNSNASQQVICTPMQNQTYTVVATLNNCSNTASGDVEIIPLPNVSIQIIKNEVCLNEEVHLKGQGGVYYEWKGPNSLQVFNQDLEFKIGSMTYAGTYTLIVADANGCSNRATENIIVHDLPGGYLYSNKLEACVPFCTDIQFKANPENQNITAGNWTVESQKFTTDKFNVCFSEAKAYKISGPIANEFNCRNTVTLAVIGRPKPEADFYFTPEHPVEGLDEVSFVNLTSNVVAWTWQSTGSVGSQQSAGGSWQNYHSTNTQPAYLFDEAGVYGLMLAVKNEFNCLDTVMKTIVVESDFAAYIPNAFTPNGDGLNDTFYPVMRGVKQFNLQIFDRWGELLFVSKNDSPLWDGTFKGEECKQDVYSYKLSLLNVRGEEKLYTGSVSLYR